MANTGVLPFVRGVDFSKNDFGVSTKSVINNIIFNVNRSFINQIFSKLYLSVFDFF